MCFSSKHQSLFCTDSLIFNFFFSFQKHPPHADDNNDETRISPSPLTKSLLSLCAALPRENRLVLRAILNLLHTVEQHQAQTKMTAKNLGTVL